MFNIAVGILFSDYRIRWTWLLVSCSVSVESLPSWCRRSRYSVAVLDDRISVFDIAVSVAFREVLFGIALMSFLTSLLDNSVPEGCAESSCLPTPVSLASSRKGSPVKWLCTRVFLAVFCQQTQQGDGGVFFFI